MKRKILTVTTNNIDGYKIEKYHGYISASFVVGASWITDFFASLTDFVGGVSKGYTKEVDNLKEMARSTLESKARLLGMNAILGFQVDIDPIFGSNYSMFMVNATGTAVKFIDPTDDEKPSEEQLFYNEVEKGLLNAYSNNAQVLKSMGIDIITCPYYEFSNYLGTLCNDISKALIKEFLDYFTKTSNYRITDVGKKLTLLKDYIMNFDLTDSRDFLNSNIDYPEAFLIRNLGLIDYEKVLNQLKNTSSENIILPLLYCLDSKPNFIDKTQYIALCNLIEYLDSNYNDKVEIKEVGFTKKKKVWICKKCDSAVDADRDICHQCDCSKYGVKLRISKYTPSSQLINLSGSINQLKSMKDFLATLYNR